MPFQNRELQGEILETRPEEGMRVSALWGDRFGVHNTAHNSRRPTPIRLASLRPYSSPLPQCRSCWYSYKVFEARTGWKQVEIGRMSVICTFFHKIRVYKYVVKYTNIGSWEERVIIFGRNYHNIWLIRKQFYLLFCTRGVEFRLSH
jgi:hypothetical protein